MARSPRPVVVGVGVDDASAALVDYAAEEAARRGTYLRLVHAYAVPPSTIGGLYGYDFPVTFRQAGEDLLAAAASWARASHPDVTVRRVLERGTAPSLLEKESWTAQLLVVGQDLDKALMMRMFEGRAANYLARHSHCPLVVVPTRWQGRERPEDVVAVLDRRRPDRSADDFAVAAAHARGCAVRRVHVDLSPGRGHAEAAAEAVRSVRDDATLIVVAQTGRDADAGTTQLVAHTLVSESTCPVAVVPPGRAQDYAGAPWEPPRAAAPRTGRR